MARRIILGQNGGGYQFKVSAAGYDAATAPLDALLFDADNIPARVAAQGAFRAATGSPTGVQTARSHGVSTPSMCIAIGRPWDTALLEPGDWQFWLRLSSSGTASNFPLNVAHMDKQYCTPFYWWADQTDGATEYCGFKFNWSGTQVIATNFCPHPIDIRWAALEF